jgi:RNA polymerase sigma-70 factor (ECF subfamily)
MGLIESENSVVIETRDSLQSWTYLLTEVAKVVKTFGIEPTFDGPKVLTTFATRLPNINRRQKEMSTIDADLWFYIADVRVNVPVRDSVANEMDSSDDKRDRVLKAAFDCRMELTAYARSLLGNYASADDVVQEAMLVVIKKFAQFQEGTSVLAWCRSIVRLEVLRLRQRNQRDRSLAERLLDDAIDASFKEFQTERQSDHADSVRKALEHCFEQVPERGRRVLKARFVDELSYEKIGERLEMKIEAVRKALFRLKKQVRTCVETNLRAVQ